MLKKLEPLVLLGITVCLGLFAAVGWSLLRDAVDAHEQEERAVFFTLRPAEDQQDWPQSHEDISITTAQAEYRAGSEEFAFELINANSSDYYFSYELQYYLDGVWYYAPHRPGTATPAALFDLPAGETVDIIVHLDDYETLLPGTYRLSVHLDAREDEQESLMGMEDALWYERSVACVFEAVGGAVDPLERMKNSGRIILLPSQAKCPAGSESFAFRVVNGTEATHSFGYELQYWQDEKWYQAPERPGTDKPDSLYTLPAGETLTLNALDYQTVPEPGNYYLVLYFEGYDPVAPASPHEVGTKLYFEVEEAG